MVGPASNIPNKRTIDRKSNQTSGPFDTDFKRLPPKKMEASQIVESFGLSLHPCGQVQLPHADYNRPSAGTA